ncbi:MAG: hypothetical protein F4202_06995 [Cenarchaeum sp. SB0677_bin_16]|nr:hypothetical protein [Cenarchaeum sp. SB0677_bin_16]
MDLKRVAFMMVIVPLVSAALLVTAPAFMDFGGNTSTDLEQTVVPTISLLAIHIALVAAPGIISIAVILYRPRLLGDSPTDDGPMSIPSKVTVIVLVTWTIFVCLVAGLAPAISG